MKADQNISLAIDRQAREIRFTERLWSSAASPWPGFRLERHVIGPAGRLADFSVPEVLVGLCLRGSGRLTVGTPRECVADVHPGCFTLLVAGAEQAPIQWHGERETLYLAMASDELDRLLGPEAGRAGLNRLGLEPRFGIDDPQVARLLLNMHDEAAAGCTAGRLYAEALCVALADYLGSTYGSLAHSVPRRGARLTAVMATRVHDFMAANLGRNLSLGELGALVGLSPHHFSLVFRNTFDATPHHYLLVQRVERAKRLLADGCSIGEAALEVGFANQSHFTRMFSRLIGQTPRAYARANA